VAVSRRGGARKPRSPAKRVRDRLDEAEATLEAIRTGQVDALVVSGPRGDRTLTLDGAAHPYFVLLNSMSDGAVLVERDGIILFGNQSFGEIAGAPLEALCGCPLQGLVAPAERAAFEEFLRDGPAERASREVRLENANGRVTPVSISLSTLPDERDRPRSGHASRGGSGVVMAIVTNLTYRNAAEATRARLLERLISAEDDERRRIARELHDEAGQALTALAVGLRAIAEMTAAPEARAIALRLRDVVAYTIDHVGRLARGLHPAVLDDMGLAAAAARYVEDYVRSFGTAVNFTVGDVDSPRLAPLAAATVYRILQEALTNVARHARAANVVVALTRDASAVELLVRDDGIGFEMGGERRVVPGLGLRGMRERVTLLDGSIRVESAPGHGTAVRVRVPVGGTNPPPARRRRARGAARGSRPS